MSIRIFVLNIYSCRKPSLTKIGSREGQKNFTALSDTNGYSHPLAVQNEDKGNLSNSGFSELSQGRYISFTLANTGSVFN
jgi:hypothetical protein